MYKYTVTQRKRRSKKSMASKYKLSGLSITPGICVYVCICVCVYVCMYVPMYVSKYNLSGLSITPGI